MRSSTCLELASLRFSYDASNGSVDTREFFGGFSVDVPCGSVVGILGLNGSGKTTLVRALAGQVPIEASQVRWSSGFFEPAGGGVVLSQGLAPFLLPWLSGNRHRSILGRSAIGPCSPIAPASMSAALDGILSQPTHSLSGGERQLLALSLLFGCTWSTAILDEPFSALDARRSNFVVTDLVAPAVADPTRTVFIVTHRLDHALFLSSTLWVLNSDGSRIGTLDNPYRESAEVLAGDMPVEFTAEIQRMLH